jgi:MFS transporter, PPP family, 3-phenylpropionic acid transporter
VSKHPERAPANRTPAERRAPLDTLGATPVTGIGPMRLPRFIALYGTMFAAFGVASPYLAALLASHGLGPAEIGIVLGSATAIRLVAGPFFAGIADLSGRTTRFLILYIAAAAVIALAYLPAYGLWPLLSVGLAHAAVLAPTTAVGDALTLAAIGRMAQYGWVRAAGSAAFIVGTLLAGQTITRFGLPIIIWLEAALLAIAAVAAALIPDRLRAPTHAAPTHANAPRPDVVLPSAALTSLLRLPGFARLMLVAALIQGSHAMHDAFVVIHWRSLGIANGTISVLWSESVAAEVIVFSLIGPFALARLGVGGASILAAIGGIIRWSVFATATTPLAWACVEPLHGLTFALQHLACMRMIHDLVPRRLAARAQAFYGTLAVGATTSVMTFASGELYARFGPGGWWVMAGLCALAIPLARFPSSKQAPQTT